MCLGMPGRIVEILGADGKVAMAEVSGELKKISLALLGPDDRVAVGDHVLINVGYAMARIDEQEAAETREMLEGFGSDFEIAAEMHGEGAAAG